MADIEKYWSALKVLIHPWGDSLRLIEEKEVSYHAGTLIGEPYDGFKEAYDRASNNSEYFYDLNVLCVRIVFCLFAENTSLFGKGAFRHFLKRYAGDPEELGIRLNELFKVLDTPYDSRGTMIEELRQFPYVDGGLFKDNIRIPKFDFALSTLLIQKCSEEFNWSGINPTIFGAIFESTLNPVTRRQNGMHYTSVENIHKVIDPLFLEDLEQELVDILKTEGTRTDKVQAIEKYRRKLGRLTFLDPACGSGNFLTETFCSLRRLENICLRKLDELGELDRIEAQGDEYLEAELKSRIHLDNFYGIEINSFACTVARAALWIAEEKMYLEYEGKSAFKTSHLPLQDTSNNIVQGNALRIDWEEIVSKEDLNYIIGNPPFVGYRQQSIEQKDEIADIFEGAKKSGKLDYVCCWFYKAAQYIENHEISVSFVSTSSIVQSEMANIFWRIMFNLGVTIRFAYQEFSWDSDSTTKASVNVIIVGFSRYWKGSKKLFRKGSKSGSIVHNINQNLIDAPSVIVENSPEHIMGAPRMRAYNMPKDGGNLLLTESDVEWYKENEPQSFKYIRQCIGGDYLTGRRRYCFYINSEEEYNKLSPESNRRLLYRIDACLDYRIDKNQTEEYISKPYRFAKPRDLNCFMCIPNVFVMKRNIAVGMFNNGVVPLNTLYTIEGNDLFIFGILSSIVHKVWAKHFSGSLGNSITYSNTLIYNTFPFPKCYLLNKNYG